MSGTDAAPPAPPAAAAIAPVRLRYLPGAIRILVPPDHPATASPDAPEVSVEVRGTVRLNGSLEDARIGTTSTNPAYRAVVEEVLKFWSFNPALVNCEFRETEGAVVLWFEKIAGNPRVSYSIPQSVKERQEAAGQDLPRLTASTQPTTRYSPIFPRDAIRAGVRRAIYSSYLRVKPDGSVDNVSVGPGPRRAMFTREITKALSFWEFPPQPVSWCGEVEIDFRLAP